MGSSNEMEQVDLIDRQAAIDAFAHKWDGMVTSVFDVINSLPSAQPDHSGDVNGMVGNTISRQDVIDSIVAWTVEDRPDIEMPTDLIEESRHCHPHIQSAYQAEKYIRQDTQRDTRQDGQSGRKCQTKNGSIFCLNNSLLAVQAQEKCCMD